MGDSAGRIGLGLVGAVASTFLTGNPFIGYAIGAYAGSYLFPQPGPDPISRDIGPRLGDLRVQLSSYGRPLPIIFGTPRIAGTVIWSTKIQETQVSTTQEVSSGGGGGKGSAPTQTITTTSRTYSISMAVSLGEGPVLGIRRAWANGKLIFNISADADYATYLNSQGLANSIRFYPGSETQTPDSLIVAINQQNGRKTPAYRGTAYVMFDNLQLAEFNNAVPNLEFEVVAAGASHSSIHVLDSHGQFGLAANGTITPGGQLLIAYQFGVSPPNGQLALVNPYDLSTIKLYNPDGYLGGFHVTPLIAPRINGNGDIVFVDNFLQYWFWPNGGAPVKIGADTACRSWVSAGGTFYLAARLLDGRYALFSVSQGSGAITVLRSFGTTGSGAVTDTFDSRDGFIWVSYPGGTNGVIEKINRNTGQVALSVQTTGVPISIAVAADQSIWYARGNNIQWWRVVPDGSSQALVFDTGNSFTGQTQIRINRDWNNGDILIAHNSSLERYNEDGTLVETLTDSATSVWSVETDSAFRNQIYTFTPPVLVGLGDQYVHVWRGANVTVTDTTVGQALTDICQRAGLAPSAIDVTAMTQTLRGFVIANRGPARDSVQQLLALTASDAVESGGKIKFVPRGGASSVTINEDDLGAAVDLNTNTDAYKITRRQEPELPHEIALSYMDYDASYAIGTQYARRLVGRSANDQQITLPVVMTATEARQVAESMLYDAWVARENYSISISDKYATVEPTDVITLSLQDGSVINGRVAQITEGQGVRQCDIVSYDAGSYTQNYPGVRSPNPQTAISAVTATNLAILDTALLRDSDDTYGVYLAASGVGGVDWPGMELYKSTDGGVTYADTTVSVPNSVPMGSASTALGNWTGGNSFDEGNTVKVSMQSGSLASTTDAAVLNGANAAYLGGEIIQFKNATLTASKTYQLSGFLRGRLGTEWAIGLHQIGDLFVVLDPTLLRTLNTATADQGVSRIYKAVTFGQILGQAAAKSFATQSNRLKPLAPVQIGGGRNFGLDVISAWTRRARRNAAWVDTVDVGLDEPTESYEIDVFAGAGKAISGISQAPDASFTINSHGFTVGKVIHVTGVNGMTQVNDRVFVVATVPDANHVTFGENTGGYTAYLSGGTARIAARTLTATTTTATYSVANQTTDYGSAQSLVYHAIYQMSSRVGRGYPGVGAI